MLEPDMNSPQAIAAMANVRALLGYIGDDPDLNSIVEALEGLIEAVQVLAADEDVVVDPFVAPRAPRSMRR